MKSDFREEFCMKNVRSGVVSKFISFVLDTCKVSAITAVPTGIGHLCFYLGFYYKPQPFPYLGFY